jgi:aldehyde:ferredoxin oxidoreductase
MYGFFNELLRVDLAAQRWAAEPLADDILARCLGGKGLGARLLLDYGPTDADPLAPESPLVLTIGPVTGTVLAPASRYALFAKSPLTGIFAESYAGGHVAPRVKATGCDTINLEGAADRQTYLP